MGKQVGVLVSVGLAALVGIETQGKTEPAAAVLFGSLLLAITSIIRDRARKA